MKQDSLEEMQAYFDLRHDNYETIHTAVIDGGIESKRVIASLLPENSNKLIDLGIGTGLELKEIFNRFPNIQITGVDISKKMLEKLKENYHNKDIDLYHMNYLQHEFKKDYYDVALSVMTLHHYTREIKIDLYKKIVECLLSKGVYIECDYMISEAECANPQLKEDYFMSEYKRLRKEQGLSKNVHYHYDIPYSVSNQIKMLKESGFQVVEEIWRKKNTVILIAKK